MSLKVNLVVLLLALTGFITVHTQPQQHINGKRGINKFMGATELPIKKGGDNDGFTESVVDLATTTAIPESNIYPTFTNSKFLDAASAIELLPFEEELRDGPVKKKVKKKKWNKALMALLLAYKLKFAALIPTIIGGLILLLSTTAMAGFFFALFAAILGLKSS